MSEEVTLDRRCGDLRPVPDPTTLTNVALRREVGRLTELMDEKFSGVKREMQLVENARVEQKKDSLDSLAAALSAAKEAVKENTSSFEKRIDKSENATNDQLRQLGEKFDTAIEGVLRSLSDLKEREAAIEQSLATHTAAGIGEGRGKEQSWGVLVGSIGGISGIVGIIVAIVVLIGR